jgi:lysophospholipase L1-like esterase
MLKCYFNKNVECYNSVLKEVSKNNKCFFVDLSGLFDNEDMEDGLHPNASGHKKIFERVKCYLIENKIIS